MATKTTESEATPKSLAAKMAAIMGEVPTMIKNGQNVQQKYQYVTAEDVKAAIRPLLKKHNVAIFSQMTDVQRESNINKNGSTVVTVVARMVFTLVDGDTGESQECAWYGEANDFADKAVNKAATAAEKYWLINTFLLSTSEPETDEETIEVPSPELSKAIRHTHDLMGRAKKVGIDLPEYSMKNVDEARRAYEAHLAALRKAAHDRGAATETLKSADSVLAFLTQKGA